jgi:hypothetical protein
MRTDALLHRLSALAPQLDSSARALLATIDTPNWALEWGVPSWIADAFGIADREREELVLASGALLAHARAVDDVADGDGCTDAAPLALLFHHLAFSAFLPLVHDHAPRFVAYASERLAQFLRATMRCSGRTDCAELVTTGEELRSRTAWRGAFIKVAGASACFAADRADAVEPLDDALDGVMAGVVLLDDQFDWAGDLAAGRWNTFIAFCSRLPQSVANRDANRRKVLEVIALRAAGGYFDLIDNHLRRAAAIANEMRVHGLAEHIEWYRAEVATCGRWTALQAEAATRDVPCT